MNNNTISANSADENGGGLRLHLEDLVSFTSVNNTVSGNNAGIEGGGLHITTMDSVVVTLRSNTITDNSSDTPFEAGGLYVFDSGSDNTFNVINTIIANSPSDINDDCSLSTFSDGLTIDSVSIIEDGTCGALRFDDPGLLPLAENGGLTLTHALSESSIALNTGASCEPNDQRSEARTDVCDVGAYESELQPTLPPQSNNDFLVIPLANGKTVVVPN